MADQIKRQPEHTVSVTNSSFEAAASSSSSTERHTASALVFPSFRRIDHIPDDATGHRHFVETILQSRPGTYSLTSAPVACPVVLICSHGARDERCGILGPLLHAEFTTQLNHAGLLDMSTSVASKDVSGLKERVEPGASVGMVSHIGGHKWAGNVIVYVPPKWPAWDKKLERQGSSELGGKGIWYGRVEPKHVEGIIKETILGGRVVEELCRGVVW